MVKYDYNDSSKTLHCQLSGRLGADICQAIAPDIREQVHKESNKLPHDSRMKVVFDLKEVDFIASGFIRICVETAKTVNTSNFSIINTHPIIKKTFKIAGLDEMLNVS